MVGTPVVARATGGLVQQVVPYPSRCFSESVRQRTNQFHTDQLHPSGFLFREPDLPESDFDVGWRTIVNCAYWPDGDRLAERMTTRLFRAMVDEAAVALSDAIDLYTNYPSHYAAMIQQGFQMSSVFFMGDDRSKISGNFSVGSKIIISSVSRFIVLSLCLFHGSDYDTF